MTLTSKRTETRYAGLVAMPSGSDERGIAPIHWFLNQA